MARPDTSQHFLYLSLTVWGETKRRAVVEASTASKLLNRLFDAYLQQPAAKNPALRPRAGELLEIFQRRSVHLGNSVWDGMRGRAGIENRSVSAIAEQLLRQYLGLPPLEPDSSDSLTAKGI